MAAVACIDQAVVPFLWPGDGERAALEDGDYQLPDGGDLVWLVLHVAAQRVDALVGP